jgi:GNAT superfamily N-acetyltransferase
MRVGILRDAMTLLRIVKKLLWHRTSHRVRDVTKRDWPLLERLFGSSGACGGCWCMHWRLRGAKAWAENKGERNRRAFKELIESGAAHGVFALHGDEPVGWCALGPKLCFARLEHARTLRGADDERTWSVVCFFVPTAWRGKGVASALLAGAIAQAKKRKVERLEGYPVKLARGARYPAAFAFVGVPALFAKAGFEKCSKPGARLVYARRP